MVGTGDPDANRNRVPSRDRGARRQVPCARRALAESGRAVSCSASASRLRLASRASRTKGGVVAPLHRLVEDRAGALWQVRSTIENEALS